MFIRENIIKISKQILALAVIASFIPVINLLAVTTAGTNLSTTGTFSASGTTTLATSAGRVGIGTTSPYKLLSISSGGDTDISLRSTAASGQNWVIDSNANGGFNLSKDTTPKLSIDGSDNFLIRTTGNVGIGDTDPAAKLEVAGNVVINGALPQLFLGSAAAPTTKGWISYDTTTEVLRLVAQNNANWLGVSSGGAGPVVLAAATASHLCYNTAIIANASVMATCSADYSEWYPGDSNVEASELVVISDTPNPIEDASAKYLMKRSSAPYGSLLLGVTSDPANGASGERKSENYMPLVLAGRVPVKVSTESGPIAIGDRITSSSLAGVGMKATTSGQTVGIALEPFDGSTATTTATINGKEVKTGKVLVFVNLGYNKLDANVQMATSDGNTLWTVDQATGKITTTYGLDLSGNDIVNVRQILSQNGAWSISEDGKLVAEEITARKKLEVGTPESPKGITLYDFADGKAHCVFVQNGVVRAVAGECTFSANRN